MDSIPPTFTIKIDGRPIAKVDQSIEGTSQAKLGEDGATFSLKDRQLRSGDWILGRSLTENRSYGPKKVSWHKAHAGSKDEVQPVTAKKEGDAYHLIFSSMFLSTKTTWPICGALCAKAVCRRSSRGRRR